MLNYKHRITLQSNSPTEFSAGCYTESWATVTTLWANIATMAVAENYQFKKGQQTSNILIAMRYTTGIDKATCRFLYEGQTVHIMNVRDKHGKKKEIVIEGRVEDGT